MATLAPSQATISSVGAAINGGNANSTKPVINGTADVGTTVNIYDGVRFLGAVTVGASGTWTFTPTVDLKAGTHSFTAIAMSSTGVNGVSSEPMSVTVASNAPAKPIITGLTDDNSHAITSPTNDARPNASGTGTPGDTITLYDGSTPVGTTTVKPDGTWTLKPTSDLPNGTNDIYVIETKPTGGAGTPSDHIPLVIDTHTPAKPSAPVLTDDSGTSIAAGSTSSDAHPNISGTGTAGDIIKVYDGANVIGTTTVKSDGTWTFKPSPDLSNGPHDLSVTETTPAGNTSLPSDHTGITVNTSTPATPPAPTATDDSNNPIPSGSTTADAHPHINGTGATPGDVIKVYDGATLLGSTTAGLDGKWTFTPSPDLSTGATHNINVTETNTAGTPSAHSPNLPLTVDTYVPGKPTITGLTDDNHNSIPAGSTSSDGHPYMNGTGGRAGDIVTLYDGSTPVGSVTITNADGSWTLKPTTDLYVGTHDLSVIETTPAGTVSPQSDHIAYRYSNIAPVPVITSVEDAVGLVTGAVPNNGVTDDMRPTINGTGVVGDTVNLYKNGTAIGTTTVGPDGHWTFNPTSDLGLGTVVLTATQYTSSASLSPASASWTITVYAATISTPTAPTITDNGNVIPSGSTMPDGHPSISGTGTAGDTIKVYDGANVIGSTTVGPDGHWSFTPTTDLSKGSAHPISVIESNAAGAASAQSPATSVTVADAAVLIPVITSVVDAVGPVQGNVPSGGVSDDNQPTVHGTGKAGDIIQLYAGEKSDWNVGSVKVNLDGTWSIRVNSPMGIATHELSATETNSAGVTGAHSAYWAITIVSSTISTPAAPTITDGGNVIPSGSTMPDGHPTISGSGTAKDIIKVYDGANVIGSTTVDSNGHWSFTPTTDLSTGSAHPISVIESNAAGATSAQSAPTSVTVGQAPNETVSITQIIEDSLGRQTVIAQNGSTIDASPTVNGTLSSPLLAGESLAVYLDGVKVGTATVNGTSWTFTGANVSAGQHAYTAQVETSVAHGPQSAPYNFSEVSTFGEVMVESQGVGKPSNTYINLGTNHPNFDANTILWGLVGSSSSPIAGYWNPATSTFTGGVLNYLGDGIYRWSGTSGGNSLSYGFQIQLGDGSTYTLDVRLTANFQDGIWRPMNQSGKSILGTGVQSVSAVQQATSVDETASAQSNADTAGAVGHSVSATVAAPAVSSDHDTGGNVSAVSIHTVVTEHDTFVGSTGNQTVDLSANPTSYFHETTAHIQGGTTAVAGVVPVNTLHLTGDHQVLDLTSLTGQTAAAKISGIEVIDLGGNTNTLKLSLTDVLNLGETDLFVKDGKQQMMVNGKEGDEVDLSNSHIAGLAEGEWQAHGTTQVGGVTYNVYEHSGVHTELLVQQGVQIVVH